MLGYSGGDITFWLSLCTNTNELGMDTKKSGLGSCSKVLRVGDQSNHLILILTQTFGLRYDITAASILTKPLSS